MSNYDVAEISDMLAHLQDRSYVVEAYTVSHKQLVIVTYPIQTEGSPTYITFGSVSYMQLHPYWENATFRIETSDACRELLLKIGADIPVKLPYLLSVADDKLIIQIVCKSIRVSNNVPDF